MARLCPDLTLLSLCHRRHVAALCMLYNVKSYMNNCLFIELPSGSVSVRHSRAAAAAHPLEFEESRCTTSQFAKVFPACPDSCVACPDIPCTVFDTGTLDGFKGTVNCW